MTKENIPEFTVTTLSQSIKKTLETEFEYVRVKGELGRVSRPASGHIYFDLKDEKSILASVVWRGTRITQRDLIEEGNEVVLVGRLTSFSGHSKYQIIVEDIKANYAGSFGTPNQTTSEDIYNQVFGNQQMAQLGPSFADGGLASMFTRRG